MCVVNQKIKMVKKIIKYQRFKITNNIILFKNVVGEEYNSWNKNIFKNFIIFVWDNEC